MTFAGLIRSLERKAALLACARAERRLRAGGGGWRHSRLVWPLFAKERP